MTNYEIIKVHLEKLRSLGTENRPHRVELIDLLMKDENYFVAFMSIQVALICGSQNYGQQFVTSVEQFMALATLFGLDHEEAKP